jgi:hypothetical protein
LTSNGTLSRIKKNIDWDKRKNVDKNKASNRKMLLIKISAELLLELYQWKEKNKIEFFDILSLIRFITFHITYYMSLHLYFPSDMMSHSMLIASGIISVCLYFPWQYVSFGVYYFRQSYYSSLLYFPFKTTYVPYCIYYFWPYVLVSLFPIRSYVLSTFCPIQHFSVDFMFHSTFFTVDFFCFSILWLNRST